MKNRAYIASDLKSFYASVECIERGLDPLTTNLVVADLRRTEKTICLAVTPSLKAWGISGRARLFEVVQRVKEVNAQRQMSAPGRQFTGSSSNDTELKADPGLAVDYIVAPPRMAHYMEWSTRVYDVYLKYVAPSDIHNYSIDEVLMDVTNYLDTYKLTPHGLAKKIILDVLETTGITATAGIGTNLYLCKIAMDIWAKHIQPDADGVRIAELDEMSYRRNLWNHRPLTDFWRVGGGYARKLESHGLYTMGDIARYGRAIPKHAHGTANLEEYTSSTKRIVAAALELFDSIIDRNLLVRRIYLTAARVVSEESAPDKKAFEQLDMFTDYGAAAEKKAVETAELEREKKVQQTMLDIKRRFGKNAILKGMNLEEGATGRERNNTIGGHRSGEI